MKKSPLFPLFQRGKLKRERNIIASPFGKGRQERDLGVGQTYGLNCGCREGGWVGKDNIEKGGQGVR
jgi:hypothetical protein